MVLFPRIATYISLVILSCDKFDENFINCIYTLIYHHTIENLIKDLFHARITPD